MLNICDANNVLLGWLVEFLVNSFRITEELMDAPQAKQEAHDLLDLDRVSLKFHECWRRNQTLVTRHERLDRVDSPVPIFLLRGRLQSVQGSVNIGGRRD
jgi:hypothetical protein